MKKVRTTISLEENLHRQLMTEAFNTNKSLSQIINIKLKNKNFTCEAQIDINKDFALFDRLAKKAGKTDWTKLIREERDRDK